MKVPKYERVKFSWVFYWNLGTVNLAAETKNGILIKDINHKKLENALIDLMHNKEKRNIYQKKAWDNFKLSSEIDLP